MADIFISYASEDRDRVRPLAEALIKRGFNVWWDRALAAGQDYTAIIERELRAAKAVIVVWTRGSVASTFVRDEAGVARDQGRLVPVALDPGPPPLGFGQIQAEDFTRWNGGSNAAQMQLLEEVLKAKLAGRDIDGAAIERRRRRTGARIRFVSLLTVVALIVVIAVGAKNFFAPPEPDIRAQLLQLLAEGRLTPEQAIQLAQLLETDALGESSSEGMQSMAAEESSGPGPLSDVQTASITAEEADAAARETYRQAFLALSQHSDAQVRLAVAQMAQPDARDAAMQTMWNYAATHPEDPLRDEMYLLCGSVGESNDNPLGQRALEVSTSLTPQDAHVWQLLSHSYARVNRSEEAQAAALVSEGVEAQASGNSEVAQDRLQRALPSLRSPELRAPVESGLGEIAESRGDYSEATNRFAQAYALREQSAAAEPQSAAAQAIDADAQQLVRALDRAGRTREACEALRRAQEEHDVAAPDQDILNRCRRLSYSLRSRVELAPQLRDRAVVRQQPAETAPAPTP